MSAKDDNMIIPGKASIFVEIEITEEMWGEEPIHAELVFDDLFGDLLKGYNITLKGVNSLEVSEEPEGILL